MVETGGTPGADRAGDGRRVSVVVPTIGRESLQECLKALRAQSRTADEIVVVEDVARRGSAWARNEGFRRAGGDLIAFVDDDVVLPPDWIERVIDAMDRHAAAGVGGGLVESDLFLEEIRQRRLRAAPPSADPAAFRGNGGLVMYHREWLEVCARVDGYVFNEDLRHAGEDWELILRMRLRGAKLVTSATVARHLRAATPLGFLTHQFRRGRGVAGLFHFKEKMGAVVDPQPSLLWDERGTTKRTGWLRVLWHKAIGPFDVHSFGAIERFALFWLGEKAQGLGFAWEMLLRRVGGARMPPAAPHPGTAAGDTADPGATTVSTNTEVGQ